MLYTLTGKYKKPVQYIKCSFLISCAAAYFMIYKKIMDLWTKLEFYFSERDKNTSRSDTTAVSSLYIAHNFI